HPTCGGISIWEERRLRRRHGRMNEVFAGNWKPFSDYLVDGSTNVASHSAKKSMFFTLTGKWRLAYYPVMADVFEALATPARRAILDELHERDGQTLFEICGRLVMKHDLGLTRQAISQHLDVLEAVG